MTDGPRAAREGCAWRAAARAEPLFATASPVRRWLLVEQSGPWGSDAILQSRLPNAAAVALRQRAREVRARLVLIRRHGRRDATGTTVFVAGTWPQRSWVEAFALDRPADLLDLDLAPLRRGRPVGGTPRDEALLLVCTNGRHDVCCAEFGRPLAAAMDAALGEPVWECSHIGGDRFAGNLVCFPHGVYYGRVSPDDGVNLAALHRQGRLDLARYRGRSAYPFLVQAADFFVRRETGLDGIEDLTPVAVQQHAEDAWQVTFDGSDGRHHAPLVRRSLDAEAARLTCSATTAVQPPRYELLS